VIGFERNPQPRVALSLEKYRAPALPAERRGNTAGGDNGNFERSGPLVILPRSTICRLGCQRGFGASWERRAGSVHDYRQERIIPFQSGGFDNSGFTKVG
jgi:hypothetical protein